MALDTNQLEKIIEFVKHLKTLKIGETFIARLREVLNEGDATSPTHLLLSNIDKNVGEIRDVLRIQASPSIDYSFIPDKYVLLRNKLIVDNLRMEQSVLDVQEVNDAERFYNFCIYAFYQIENLVNYYYLVRFPNFNDLVLHLEKNSYFKLTDKQTTIADIAVAYKLWTFCAEHFKNPDSNAKYPFTNRGSHIQGILREIRNQGLHRCHVLFEDKTAAERASKEYIYKFYHNYTTEYVRNLVVRVVEIIKREQVNENRLNN